jgi:succinate dehydrogenase / fumarate reductase flavoprotein subunit
MCDEGRGVGEAAWASTSTSADAIKRLGKHRRGALRQPVPDVRAITGEDPYKVPMRIYPAVHYTMGGLWVDYNLMTHIPACTPGRGQLQRSRRQPPGRQRAHAGAGRRLLRACRTRSATTSPRQTRGHRREPPAAKAAEAGGNERTNKLLAIKGKRTADSFHRELGKLMWDNCGMGRNRAGLETNLRRIPEIRAEFWQNLSVPGTGNELNKELEKAGRVADFLELGELMCRDALDREESCGGHFREEHQTPDGEAARNDEKFAYAAAWEWKGEGQAPVMHKETLNFDYVHPTQRSYK